jgi:hypothetical protein
MQAAEIQELKELWEAYPQDARTEKATKLLDKVDPNILKYKGRLTVFVKDYAVTIEPEMRKCECPDHIYRRLDCKHIRAAVLYLTKNGEGGNGR